MKRYGDFELFYWIDFCCVDQMSMRNADSVRPMGEGEVNWSLKDKQLIVASGTFHFWSMEYLWHLLSFMMVSSEQFQSFCICVLLLCPTTLNGVLMSGVVPLYLPFQ